MKTDYKHLKYRSSAIRRAPQTETITDVSVTVPDQAMGIRTILQRYVQGMLPDVDHENYYNDINGMDGEDIRGLDLVEIRERRLALQEQADALHEEDMRRQKKERDDYNKYKRDREIQKRNEMIRGIVKDTPVEPNSPTSDDFIND